MRIEECPRCSTVTFAGRIDGLPYRLDTITVPPEHAAILDIYGRELAVVEIRRTPKTGLTRWRPFAPHAHLPNPPGYILAEHRCGAAPHVRRSRW